MPKKAYFGAKMAVFGPNILIILGGSKSSGTHISENYLCAELQKRLLQLCLCGTHITENHFVGIVFLSGMGPLGPKKIFSQIYQFLAKFGRFWAKNPFLGGRE